MTPEVVLIDDIFALMIVFCLKHFVADFLLQGKYMLGKFKEHGWQLPLAAHCGVHFAFTFLISWAFLSNHPKGAGLAFIFAGFDFAIHFIMDRIKASPNMMGRWKNFSSNEYAGFLSKGFLPPTHFYRDMECTIHEAAVYEAKPEELKKIYRSNTLFWWALGFDQMVHALTDVFIMYALVTVI